MVFLERVSLEIEDLQEELKGLPMLKPGCRVGDFGCGEGFSTLGLMLLLQAKEAIGVDKFSGDAWSLSCQTVQQSWGDVKKSILNDVHSGNVLQQDLRKLFSEGRFPSFQQGDVLIGHNLPRNLDFAYCKKVLGNIYSGEYGNYPQGEEGLNQSLNYIAATLKQGGIFCAVEKTAINFATFIEQAGYRLLNGYQVQRGEISVNGRLTSSMRVENCVVYLYKKS